MASTIEPDEAWGRLRARLPEVVLENARDAIVVVDVGTHVIRHWNRAAEEMYGYRAAEAVGQRAEEVIPTRYTDGVTRKVVIREVSERGVWRGEVTQRHRGGRDLRVEAVLCALRADDGTLVGMAAINRDVTARFQAGEALHQSEANLRALFDSAREAHYLVGPDLRVLAFNRVAMEGVARTRNRAIGVGDSALEFVPADSRDAFLAHFMLCLAGQPARYERRLVLPGGRVAWYELSYTPVRSAAGDVIAVAFSGLDVTDRKHRDEQLRLRERALAATTTGVLIVDAQDPALPIIQVNPAFTAMTGYSESDAMGRSPALLEGTVPDPEEHAAFLAAAREGRPFEVRARRFRRDGTPFRAHLSVSPVQDAEGKVTHLVGILIDETERVALEEQVRHSQRVESVGRLAGGIAHDFNNLLSIILTYGEGLLASAPSGTDSRFELEEIQRAALRAAELTRQLLAYARRQHLVPRVIELGETVTALVRTLRRLIREDVAISVRAPAAPAFVRVDPVQLEQVLVNLALNARDAMPAGGTLSLDVERLELDAAAAAAVGVAPGPYARLTVTDTGAGMDASTLSRALEPFFTTKEVGQGTGLGLSTALGIVEQSGGFLRLRSAPREGTTVTVHLPCVDHAPAPAEAPAAEPRSGAEWILLVEDDPDLRTLAAGVLRKRDYRVIEAEDAPSAVSLFAALPERPELLLTDVVLPGLSGPELARRLTAEHPGLRVLFMSGYPSVPEPQQAALGEHHFLAKPITADSLARKVREVLDQPRGGPSR